MNILSILPTYVLWHYTKAPVSIFFIVIHLSRSIVHFFSIPTLLKTLFSPWRKLSEDYSGGFDVVEILTSFTVNTTMRIFGAFFRITMIVLALCITLVFILFGILFFIYWLVMPVAVVFLLINGFFLFTF